MFSLEFNFKTSAKNHTKTQSQVEELVYDWPIGKIALVVNY